MRAGGAVAGLLATAGLVLTVLTGGLAPALADPPPPADPTIPVPADPAAPTAPIDPTTPADPAAAALADPAAPPNGAAEPQSLLGQVAQATQGNPYATMKGLIGDSAQPTMAVGLGTLPPQTDTTYLNPANANPWSTMDQLKPQNFRMPSPDQLSPYGLSPNDNPSPFARVNAFKGVHAVTHSNLGRMPGAQLGEPLPGTAPQPGSNIPAGLEQFYVDPNAVPPAATVAVPPGTPPGPDALIGPAAADPLLLVPPPAN